MDIQKITISIEGPPFCHPFLDDAHIIREGHPFKKMAARGEDRPGRGSEVEDGEADDGLEDAACC